MSADTLLSGAPDRWQPSRCGVVNAWQYANETLQMERGRLLLHGPNGSGKTMLLEMLWPFLLDTSIRPSHLSTGGTDRGTLAARLTGYTTGQARTSFLWAEFARRGGDPGEVFTIGVRCRVPASGTSLERRWFTTDQRIGSDLSLLDAEQRPISAEDLTARLEGRGTMWGADDAGYRRAVRERLFADHTEESMDRLIETIRVVRQKEITSRIAKSGSARAQARELAGLLTAALPPLDRREVERAAAGFERLDRRRAAIEDLERQQHVLTSLGSAATAAARVQLLRVAQAARSAQTRLDGVTREERHAEEALTSASGAVERLDGELAAAEQAHEDARSTLTALQASQAYADAQQLITLGERLAAVGDVARAAERLVSERQSTLEDARRRDDRAQADLDRVSGELEAAVGVLANLVRAARLATLDAGTPVTVDALGEIAAALDRRRAQAAAVQAALAAHGEATRRRDEAESTREATALRHDDRRRDHEAAAAALQQALDSLAADLGRWAATRRHLAVDLPDRLVEDAVGGEDPDRVSQELQSLDATVRAAVTQARDRVLRQVAGRRQQVEAARTALAERRSVLQAELEVLRSGTVPPPEAPVWRADRTGRAGGPLYRCVDVRDDADPATVDAVEAALTQSGVLDGWVDPDGTVATDDVTLRPLSGGRVDGADQTLAAVLVADAEAPVPAGVVDALLNAVVLVDRDADRAADRGADAGSPAGAEGWPGLVVGRDGSWRLGPAAGRATSRPAAHLGTGARERRRLAMIAQLEADLADLRGLIAAHDADLAELAATERALAADLDGLPTTAAVPVGTWREARVRLRDAADALATADAAVAEAGEAVRRTQVALNQQVADSGLPARAEVLAEVAEAARDGLGQVRAVRGRLADRDRERDRRQEAAAVVTAAAAGVAAAQEESNAAGRAHRDLQVQLETLEATVGAAAAEVRAQVAAAEEQEATLRTTTLPRLRRERQDQGEVAATAKVTLTRATDDRQAAEATRGAAFDTVRQALDVGLAVDAGIAGALPATGSDGVETVHAVRAAVTTLSRELEALRVSSDDAAWTRARNALAQEAYAAKEAIARHNMEPEVLAAGSLEVLRLGKDGRRLRLDEAAAELRGELDTARAELGEAEEQAFRSTLTGGLRQHLADRLRTATAMVDAMNTILTGITTQASNVTVALRWTVDPAVDTAEAVARFRALLLTDTPTDAERAEMYAFLRRRIEQLEAQADVAEDLGSWADRLGRILDYRAWHTFEVMVGHAGRPTPTRFGNRNLALSTGEHALVLVLPLLAAVTAHYLPRAGSVSRCPRLLVMDEVFPTVDAENKRQLFGLMSALDLDWVMTSDKEWCTYDTVDGIAIHSVQKDGDESFTTRFTWDGRQRRSAPVEEADDHAGSLL